MDCDSLMLLTPEIVGWPPSADIKPASRCSPEQGRVAAGKMTWNGEGLHVESADPVASCRGATSDEPS